MVGRAARPSGRSAGAGSRFGRRLVSSRAMRVRRSPARRVRADQAHRRTHRVVCRRLVLAGCADCSTRSGAASACGAGGAIRSTCASATPSTSGGSSGSSRTGLLRLAAEMKIPGRLWLQFEVDPTEHGASQVRQTTVFDPAGYVGLAYWYLFCPLHHRVFRGMLRGIGRAVEATGRRQADRASVAS